MEIKAREAIVDLVVERHCDPSAAELKEIDGKI